MDKANEICSNILKANFDNLPSELHYRLRRLGFDTRGLRTIEEILADYERLNRAHERQELADKFRARVLIARKDWTPATKQTRLVAHPDPLR